MAFLGLYNIFLSYFVSDVFMIWATNIISQTTSFNNVANLISSDCYGYYHYLLYVVPKSWFVTYI